LLAERLGWSFVDTDADIATEFGCSVPEIFARDGESVFRAAERSHLLNALAKQQTVVATGGGAPVDPALWTEELLLHPETLVIALDAEPATVFRRLTEQQNAEGASVGRPMVAGDDPLAKISALKSARQAVYDRAGVTIIADAASPARIVEEIVSLPSLSEAAMTPAVTLRVANAESKIFIAPGVRERAGKLIRAAWPNSRRVWIISDANVGPLHAPELRSHLEAAGFSVQRRDVPAGESSKSWATAGELLDWLLNGGIERSDIVIALGGGVIGDLAGFVAATVVRGVPLVQMPTSLLAMVDSSVGGKTGVNQAAGKNLIGAFYQPPIVLIDPVYLQTLPERERRSGWAEIIKHAFIQPATPGGERADLLRFLERNVDSLNRLEEPAITYAIRRNVALKAAVVEADERETGIRAYLNFGHTLGHAIEASGYRYLHGEAIAVGLSAAMRIGESIGASPAEETTRMDRLLTAFELPRTAKADEQTVLAKMKSDKKRARGVQRWVMPKAGGGVEIRTDIPDAAVTAALAQVLNPGAG
jgi:shikimate kinase/3-dehydroquinate synthase